MENKVEFKLKFLLNSLTLRVLHVENVSDPKKVVAFNNRFCDHKKTQAFCTEIANSTVFPMFGVPLTPNSKIHKATFCEIAIGKSLFVSKEYANSLDVPNDYDSFIISQNDINGFLVDSEIDVSNFSYMIKDASRILPLYEVTFEYDEEFERLSRNSFICHRCKKAQSVMFCPSERASFCMKCDSEIHNDDFLKRHRRLYFADVGQKKFICCMNHPSRVVEYFCETCMEPLCTDCKITGDHSGADKYAHPIISFLDACQMLKSKVLECTNPVNGLLETCDKEICRFKDKVCAFRNNIGNIRKQVEKEYKSIMLQIDNIESLQRQIINAKYAERVTKNELLKRVEFYPSELDPADLLSEFKAIRELINNESTIVFDKYEPEKVEVNGKMTLHIPKEQVSPKLPVSDSKEKSIRWRIETMHMTKE